MSCLTHTLTHYASMSTSYQCLYSDHTGTGEQMQSRSGALKLEELYQINPECILGLHSWMIPPSGKCTMKFKSIQNAFQDCIPG